MIPSTKMKTLAALGVATLTCGSTQAAFVLQDDFSTHTAGGPI